MHRSVAAFPLALDLEPGESIFALIVITLMVFTTLCLAQMGHALSARGARPLIRVNPFRNPWLLWAVGLTTVLQLLLLYVSALAILLGTVLGAWFWYGVGRMVNERRLERWLDRHGRMPQPLFLALTLALTPAGQQRTLSRFLRNLQLLWQESQPLPEPRQKRRYTPRLRTLFLEHREQIEQWLERESGMNAAEILRRLIRLAPGTYHEGQLRSMERRVKEWRTARAERLLGSLRSAGKESETEETSNPVATPIGGNN